MNSAFKVMKKLSATALSQQSPLRLMLHWMPLKDSDSWYSSDAYWLPRSL